MSATMSRSAQRRADHLRALRDHPSTSPTERAAAEEALRRIGIEPERPWGKPESSPWGKPTSLPADDFDLARRRADFDERIRDIQTQMVSVSCALHDARIAEARATTLRRVYEGELADLQQQLAHQRAGQAAVA